MGYDKAETKKYFQKWMNQELNWHFEDSVISATCCVDFQYDTVSVWTAKYEDYFEFKYYFNQHFMEFCDSISISSSCDSSGLQIVHGLLQDWDRWRAYDDSTFFKKNPMWVVMQELYYTPKMTYHHNKANFEISIWLEPLEKRELEQIKTLSKIKVLPSEKFE